MKKLDFFINNTIYPLNRVLLEKLYKYSFGRFVNKPFTTEMVNKKVLFVHIPKTGGSSVATALIGKPTGHPYLYEFYLQNKRQTKEFFKFCVVRNPYDRVVSAYSHIALRNCPQNFKDTFKKLRINCFEDLIDCLDDVRRRKVLLNEIIHFRPQVDLIAHRSVKMDAIYKFEDFDGIEEDLNKRFLLNIKIEQLNNSPRGDYHNYYNDRAIEVIKKVYIEDLTTFNYAF